MFWKVSIVKFVYKFLIYADDIFLHIFSSLCYCHSMYIKVIIIQKRNFIFILCQLPTESFSARIMSSISWWKCSWEWTWSNSKGNNILSWCFCWMYTKNCVCWWCRENAVQSIGSRGFRVSYKQRSSGTMCQGSNRKLFYACVISLFVDYSLLFQGSWVDVHSWNQCNIWCWWSSLYLDIHQRVW